MMPLDAINGPTLTIEGRDAGGSAKSWFVRLWNYAQGESDDAQVTLDFGDMAGGFLLPGEADPVYAGDIDGLSISLVPPYSGPAPLPLAGPAGARAELTEMRRAGRSSVLAIGDTVVREHLLRAAQGYDARSTLPHHCQSATVIT